MCCTCLEILLFFFFSKKIIFIYINLGLLHYPITKIPRGVRRENFLIYFFKKKKDNRDMCARVCIYIYIFIYFFKQIKNINFRDKQ